MESLRSLRAAWLRLLALLGLHRSGGDLEAELASHLAMHTEDGIRAGLTAKEARRQALLRLGGAEQTRQAYRERGTLSWLETLAQDMRHGLRVMVRNRAFTAVVVLTLAIGIGASTAIFSAVNPILFEPLPYPHADRLMMIWDIFRSQRTEVTFGTFHELMARSRSFDSIAAFEPWQPAITGADRPERLDGQSVSTSYFQVLGVAPALGREFQPADEDFRGRPSVILSHRLWIRRFASDREIVGRQVKLGGNNYTVIGVMPHEFENVLSASAEIWTPLQYEQRNLANFSTTEWGHHLRIVGRLHAGVALDQARRELDEIARAQQKEFPRPRWASLDSGLLIDSLKQDMVRGVKLALMAVLVAVTLVLMIACVNVTNLLLARGAQRRIEFAMRATLGAGRARLIRQSLTESLMLALVGGAIGLALAVLGVRVLIALSPQEMPRLSAIAIDGKVFAFTLTITSLIGLAAGLAPALHAPHVDLHAGLRLSTRTASGTNSWTRGALIVSEVALALMLLVSAGLLLRSMQHLLAVDPGFRSDHLLTMQVQTSGHQFDDSVGAPGSGDTARRRFFEQALEQVRKVPGVISASFSSLLPLSDDPYWVAVYGSHFESDAPQGGQNVFRYAISPGYCETMGISLLKGRFLDTRDKAGAPQAALISESLARRRFPGRDPLQEAIGKRLHVGPTDRPWYTVVGVVDDVKQTSLTLNEPDAVYLSTAQTWFADDAPSLVATTQGDAAALAPAIRNAIWSVDKDQPIVRLATMNELLRKSVAERRFVLILFEAFAAVALVLAAIGIYGVLANRVLERTREIGVRTALGASRGSILTLVMRQGMMLTALGALIGLCGAIAAGKAIGAMLFDVSRLDLLTYVSVVALLLCASAIACFIPALRAASIDPIEALKAE